MKSTNSQNTNLALTIYKNISQVNETRELPKVKAPYVLEYTNISKELIVDSLLIVNNTHSIIDINYASCTCDKAFQENEFTESCTKLIPISFSIEYTKLNSKELNLFYLTKGLSWISSYTLIQENNKLNLECWFNITNNSGISYNNASLKFVSGDINFNSNEVRPLMYKSSLNFSASESIEQKQLEDYYIYYLDGKYTLTNNSTKRFKSLTSNSISFEKYYDFSYYDTTSNIIIKFKNSKENNLGIPLPKGTFYSYIKSNDTLEFIGSNTIGNTPIDESISLNIGKAFDVTCNRKVLKYEKYKDYELKEIEYVISNSKNEDTPIKICEPIFAPYELLSYNTKITKNDSGNPCFETEVKANSKKSILFTYKIKL